MASCKGRTVYATHLLARSAARQQHATRGRYLVSYRCADNPEHFHNGGQATATANNVRIAKAGGFTREGQVRGGQ